MEKQYSVCLFLTHPDLDNDDCMTGADFDTEAEARECIANLHAHFSHASGVDECPFVMLDGPDVNEITERPGIARRNRRQAAMDRAEERRERAMQAGMAFGCQGYNDEMGF